MTITYKDKKIEKLCTSHAVASKELGNPKLAVALATLISDLREYKHILDFHTVARLQKYRAHELVGKMRGITSMRIDYSYRLLLTVEVVNIGENEDEIIVLEVSNHYE